MLDESKFSHSNLVTPTKIIYGRHLTSKAEWTASLKEYTHH